MPQLGGAGGVPVGPVVAAQPPGPPMPPSMPPDAPYDVVPPRYCALPKPRIGAKMNVRKARPMPVPTPFPNAFAMSMLRMMKSTKAPSERSHPRIGIQERRALARITQTYHFGRPTMSTHTQML